MINFVLGGKKNCFLIQEGFDISYLNKDLVLEMEKAVSLNKYQEVETALRKGIRLKHFTLLHNLLHYIEDMRIVLDASAVVSAAKRCYSAMKESELLREMYFASWYPISKERIQVK